MHIHLAPPPPVLRLRHLHPHEPSPVNREKGGIPLPPGAIPHMDDYLWRTERARSLESVDELGVCHEGRSEQDDERDIRSERPNGTLWAAHDSLTGCCHVRGI